MFKRPRHQRVMDILQALNSDLLQESECYFAGGTAIVLQLDEYRESVDVDFLCNVDGYRVLRSAIAMPTLGKLVTRPVKYARDVRADRDKISTYLDIDGEPTKVEFVLEARIPISGAFDAKLAVPVLSRSDLYAEKLLANADRGTDRAVMSRDLIDLAMMIRGWGPIPDEAWRKVVDIYGSAVAKAYGQGLELMGDRRYLDRCLHSMSMDPGLGDDILETLQGAHPGAG